LVLIDGAWIGVPQTLSMFSLVVAAVSVGAGALGALTGLGGGVIIVPALTLAFGVNIRYAMGASLVSVIATSSGAAASYVREGFTNIRIGMFLEVATTTGALIGAFITGLISPDIVAVIFGLALLTSAALTLRAMPDVVPSGPQDPIAERFGLSGSYPTPTGPESYSPRHVATGFGVMFGAGALSGLLGIGSGAVKVLAMDRLMQLPFKVSTTTSNFMIGVTAAASAGVYLHRGYIEPALAMPVMLGILVGATVGTRVLVAARVLALRRLFTAVIVLLGLEMVFKGLTHGF
jgi:uncharacterized membrane protein YfcA